VTAPTTTEHTRLAGEIIRQLSSDLGRLPSDEEIRAEIDRLAAPEPAAQVYLTSPIKPRQRATQAEMVARRQVLYNIVWAMKPMTVRQVFYQATVRGIVDKSESGYSKIQTDLVAMRRAGHLPYSWIADNTRWMRKPDSYNSMEEAVRESARLYRKNLWSGAACYVEIWLEKDALSGVIFPITASYDVPLMVARGYASLSFLHAAAEAIDELDVPAFIYHLGDYDPSGINAGEKIEQTLRELAPSADIRFQRLAVTPEQIKKWKLPSRPTKTTDSRARKFGTAESVELDAIPPNRLRDIVEQAICRHFSQHQIAVARVAEARERDFMHGLVNYLRRPEATQ
jgi:hypothetical protein